MTREEWNELVRWKPVLLDGATGSNLLSCGMPRGICAESWILEHQDVLIQLQREYQKAGSQILYAPTFSANRIGLEGYGLEKKVEEYNERLVHISREAAQG